MFCIFLIFLLDFFDIILVNKIINVGFIFLKIYLNDFEIIDIMCSCNLNSCLFVIKKFELRMNFLFFIKENK